MSIDVCVCTFRRPSLAATLKSLDAQDVSGRKYRVIVVDNDNTPSAAAQVEELGREMNVEVTYVHAPSHNISIARNAALDTADAEFVAFIDDDEFAPKDWLTKMLETAEAEQLDIVLGPTVGQYKPDDPKWITRKEYHSFMPYRRSKVVETGSSGNALLRVGNPIFDGERFLLEKGRTGGEDTEYFNRLRLKGAKVGLTDSAPVFEPVAENRMTFSWIASRKYRTGMSYGRHVAIGEGVLSRLKVSLFASAKVVFSGAAALVSAWSQTHRNYWILRATFHYGVLSATIGSTETEHY